MARPNWKDGECLYRQLNTILPPENAQQPGERRIPCGKYTTPGHLSIDRPASKTYWLSPNNYTYGFNRAGKIIGMNSEMPYPAYPKDHSIPFSRLVEWYTTDVLGLNERKQFREKTSGRKEAEEPISIFFSENDESYNQWVASKEDEISEWKAKQKAISNVPQEIKNLPGHSNLSRLETTNETYGQYLDLRPKYPAIYPLPAKIPPMPLQLMVRSYQSNMSDHPLIPDHSFAVDPREMLMDCGCYTRGTHGSVHYPEVPRLQKKTAFTFSQNAKNLGITVGERRRGFTWPVLSPTGLELNQRLPTCVSVLTDAQHQQIQPIRVHPQSMPFLYSRYKHYTALPSQDKETEPNPAQRDAIKPCVPCDPRTVSNSRLDPCDLRYINPRILPVPVERRALPQIKI